MPLRSSRRPQRRAFSSRFRKRGPGLRSQHDLRRWEFGNFRILDNRSIPTGTQTTFAVALAQIFDHMSDSSTAAGALDTWKTRAIEIGGIVWSWNVFLNQAPTAALSAHAIIDSALYVDRLSIGGSPTTVPAFNLNTPPMAAATAVSAATPELAFPTRILWRETRVLPTGANDVGLPHPQTYYAGARSLRTKLRLQDDFGLFLAFGAFQSTGSAQSFTNVASGTIYWRTRY